MNRVYKPTKVFIDGAPGNFSTALVESRKAKAIYATFDTDPVDWKQFNSAIICPVIRYFDRAGTPSIAICGGYQIMFTPQGRGGAPGPARVRLLPRFEGSSCPKI
jgi:hypothetical protein